MALIDRYILEKSIFRGKKALGITIDFQSSGTVSYSIITVKREKSNIQKESEMIVVSEKDELFSKIDSSLPICLTISGTKIVHREMNIADDQSESDILNSMFPNASINDFYVQKDLLNNSRYFVSVIRREVLDGIIDDFKQKNICIVSVDLAIGAFTQIKHLLPEKTEYRCGSFILKMSNETIVSCENAGDSSEIHYEVGTDEISSTILNSFAQCVFFLSASDQNELFESIQSERESFLYKSFIKQGITVIAVSFLLILLINFFLFDNYYKKHNELESTLNQNKDLLIKLDTLKNDLKTKEELFQESGFIHQSRLSFYSDHIAASVTESIILDEVNCIPVDKKLKQEQEVTVKQACIIISGNVSSSTEMNEWIGRLGKESWVKSVNILSYLQDNNFSRGDFQINIAIKE
jgi:hypothetical protein